MYTTDYKLFDPEKKMNGIAIRKIICDDRGNQHAKYEYGETPQRAFKIIENAECRLRSKQNPINELLRRTKNRKSARWTVSQENRAKDTLIPKKM